MISNMSFWISVLQFSVTKLYLIKKLYLILYFLADVHVKSYRRLKHLKESPDKTLSVRYWTITCCQNSNESSRSVLMMLMSALSDMLAQNLPHVFN